MQSVRQIQRLNDAELEKCVPPTASWHTDYRDTAYIHFGGIPFELSEGDVLTIFSQYGNPVHISLIRDKETGKSRGFGFLKYEDQRSCDLAVDNLSGAGVLGRVMTVDHARYKLKDGEIEGEGMDEDTDISQDDDTDREEEGHVRQKRQQRRRPPPPLPPHSSDDEASRRPQIQEELELAKLLKEHDDDDPMKSYLVKEKKEQIAEALKQLSVGADKTHRSDRHRHRRDARERKEHQRDKRDAAEGHSNSHAVRERPPTNRTARRSPPSRSRSRDRSSSRRRHRHDREKNRDESSADERRKIGRRQHQPTTTTTRPRPRQTIIR